MCNEIKKLTDEQRAELEEELHELRKAKKEKEAYRNPVELWFDVEASETIYRIEHRIWQIEVLLGWVSPVTGDGDPVVDFDYSQVNLGCTVKVLDIEFDEEMEYKIVINSMAKLPQGKLSDESALGSALLGKHVGDVISVKTDAGEFQYKVIDITWK